jgi:hypothetical protein
MRSDTISRLEELRELYGSPSVDSLAVRCVLPSLVALVTTSWVIVTFGDSGSLRHNCDERLEGGTLENPY